MNTEAPWTTVSVARKYILYRLPCCKLPSFYYSGSISPRKDLGRRNVRLITIHEAAYLTI